MFCYFFGIFFSGSGRNPSEWFFFSLFLGHSHPILAWKEATMVFSNFLNFFAIFLEFSIVGRVGTHQNDFFNFLSFSAFPNLFWLEKKLWWCFLIFWIFLLFFWNFLFQVGRNPSEWFFFFLSFSDFPILFWLEKKLWWRFLIFWIFLLFFLKFSITGRVGTHQNDFFYFLSFSTFPNLFWIEKKLW